MARKHLMLTLLLLGGCNWYYNTLPSPDDLMKAIPWFDHMIKGRAIFPYARADVPRYSVPGTIPITGGEADWEKDWKTNPSLTSFPTADRLVNPVPRDSLLARGDTLFHTFCAVCHGGSGAGDGPVNPKFGGSIPPLISAKARSFTDGYIYSVIRYGRGNMPRYGDKLYHREDRWAVVNYLRTLQSAAGPLPVVPAPSAGPPVRPSGSRP